MSHTESSPDTILSPEDLAALIAASPKAEDISKMSLDQIPSLSLPVALNPVQQITPCGSGSGQNQPAIHEPSKVQKERLDAMKVGNFSPPMINASQPSEKMVPQSSAVHQKVGRDTQILRNPFTDEACGTVRPETPPVSLDEGISSQTRQAGPFTAQHDFFAGQPRIRINYTGLMTSGGITQEIPYAISATPLVQRRPGISELNPLWDRVYDLMRAYWEMEERAKKAEDALARAEATIAENDPGWTLTQAESAKETKEGRSKKNK